MEQKRIGWGKKSKHRKTGGKRRKLFTKKNNSDNETLNKKIKAQSIREEKRKMIEKRKRQEREK